MVVVSHLFFFFQINFREGMTQRKSYPPCFGTIYFPTARLFMQNSVFILCGKVFFRLYSMWIIKYYRLIIYFLRCVSYPSESSITLSLLTDSFIPLFSLIPNQIQEYSEINSLYFYILSFSQNIL